MRDALIVSALLFVSLAAFTTGAVLAWHLTRRRAPLPVREESPRILSMESRRP